MLSISKMRVRRMLLVISGCLFAIYILWSYQQHQHTRQDATVDRKKVDETKGLVNGCIVVLATNEDLADIINTIHQFEYRFNDRYHYPYVLLNDAEFTPEFRERVSRETRSLVEFGKIPQEQWSVPSWIDRRRLERAFNTSLKVFHFHLMLAFFPLSQNAQVSFIHSILAKQTYYSSISKLKQGQFYFITLILFKR